MNERIKELSLKAAYVIDLDDPRFLQKYSEKFAKLLIAECISVMDATSKEAQKNFTYMGDDVPTTAHQYEIRKHFGVNK